jgi:hypothetical protein
MGLGHIRRTALMPAGDETDGVRMCYEPIEQPKVAFTGNAKNQSCAMDLELISQDLAAAAGFIRLRHVSE